MFVTAPPALRAGLVIHVPGQDSGRHYVMAAATEYLLPFDMVSESTSALQHLCRGLLLLGQIKGQQERRMHTQGVRAILDSHSGRKE
jgi:hypothetical protein